MRKSTIILFILLAVSMAVAGVLPRKPQPLPAGGGEKQGLVESRQFPNAELERGQVAYSVVLHASQKKNISFTDNNRIADEVAGTAFCTREKKSCDIPGDKAYLSHIHPTHTHW